MPMNRILEKMHPWKCKIKEKEKNKQAGSENPYPLI
jgi:hypothetical protein